MSDFSVIEAVAASSWFVYAASTHGLLIYDRVSRRFRNPVTAIDGYPAMRVRRAIADPTANAVWLDLGAGAGYLRYDVDGRAWTPGSPTFTTGTLTVEAALAGTPLVDAMRAAILTDQRLRTHQFTAAAATPDRPEIFFGTNGLGLVRVDKQTGEWEVLSYGLLAPAVGAVTRVPSGVWSATSALAGRAQRRGLSWVASDLSSTKTSEGGRAALGFSFLYARRLLADGDYLWIATEQGVLRVDSTGFAARLWALPDATCLALSPRGIWAGTAHGLSLITADEQVQDIGPSGIAVTSLLAAADTLWVGTSAGLARVVPGSTEMTTPTELSRASLRVTIYALARLQDTIVMATERELFWRDPATQAWTPVPLSPALGIPTALTTTPQGGLWIGGTRGLARADLRSGLMHVHTVPFEIPAPVRDLAADRDHLWAATDSGLVRIP